jgi:hypothetical protein
MLDAEPCREGIKEEAAWVLAELIGLEVNRVRLPE